MYTSTTNTYLYRIIDVPKNLDSAAESRVSSDPAHEKHVTKPEPLLHNRSRSNPDDPKKQETLIPSRESC